MKAHLYIDGGSRGNPGPAAIGYILETTVGVRLAEVGEQIGEATNNVAEYSALIAGLRVALDFDVTELEVVSDSELVVKQMLGEYKVKSENLRAFYRRAILLESKFKKVTYRSVTRDLNVLTDKLVNEAFDH